MREVVQHDETKSASYSIHHIVAAPIIRIRFSSSNTVLEAAYDTARSNTRVKKQREDQHRRRVVVMAAATKTHHQRSLRSGKSIRGSSSKSSKSSAKSSKHSRDDHDGYNSYDAMDDYSMSGSNDLNNDEIISNGVKEEEEYRDGDVGLIPAEVSLHIIDKEEDTQDDGSASSSLSDSTSNNMMPAIKPLTTAEHDDTNSSLAEDETTAQIMMNPTNNTETTIMDEESSLVKNATDNFEYVDLQSRNRSWTAAVISIVAIGSLASLVLGLYTRKNKQKEGRDDDMSSIWSTYE